MADTPMTPEEIDAFRESAPDREGGPLWSLLDWSFWGAGMADVFREPLANVMLAAIPGNVREHAEAIMADFIERRSIEKTGVTVYQEQRAEMERLRAVEARVRALHQPTEGLGWDCDEDDTPNSYGRIDRACTTCGTADEYAVRWPCPTIRALNGDAEQGPSTT